MKKLVLALTAFSLLAGSGPSLASPCRDKNGKFVKCPAKVPAKPKLCRGKNGKFAKCPS